MRYAQAMLPVLHAAERDSWHHLVTDDESWFFLDTSPRRVLTLLRDYVIKRSRHDVQSKRIMFMIIWNLHGFCIVDKLSNDIKKNNDYFTTNILSPREQAIFA
jgi:hypothetical protein